jgi:hypothetical protein
MEILIKVGVQFSLDEGANRRSFLHGYETGLQTAFFCDRTSKTVKPWVFMSIGNHEEEHRVKYASYKDVPIVDVPCGCGDPNCWLIQWS